jgi:hypothetical protein
MAGWGVLRALLPDLPVAARFWIAWLLFTFGPGAAAGGYLTRDLDPLRRTIVLLGTGSATAPVLIFLLGWGHLLAAFPYVASALAGACLAVWTPREPAGDRRTPSIDLAACAVLVVLALGIGAIVFSHRLETTGGGIQLFGDYDSLDLSFYAAWAAEASHTVPPTASYYAGHALNAAYYPQLVLAMVHRFAGVPTLPIYFRYAWPAVVSLGLLTAYVLARSLAGAGVALLAGALILIGGDFSYLAAWWLPHDTGQWDFLLWPTNFLSPTMEILQFNTWAQTLPVFFTALYAIVRGMNARRYGWTVLSAVLLATLFQFKPFAYAIVLAALFAAAVFSGRDWVARRRFAVTLGLAVVCAIPFVYSVVAVPIGDRRSRLLIDFFLLPRRMLLKLDLADTFARVAAHLAPAAALRQPIVLLMATVVFFAGGLGIRWVGLPGVWRGIRADATAADAAVWRLLAWTVVAGVAVPFVLVTDPYVDTLQFYQTGLYVLWLFTAVGLGAMVRQRPIAGAIVLVLAVAAALPSSVHFLARKWTDNRRPPLMALSRGEVQIARYLRATDPETTVVLTDRPGGPSLIPAASDRRIVLAYSRPYYAVGSDGPARDVDAFYASAEGDPAAAFDTLRRYHVTHVVVLERDHVHPTVLSRLQVMVQSPDATLYAVPRD